MDDIETLQNDQAERLAMLDAEIAVLEQRTDSDAHKDRLIKERKDRRESVEGMYERAIERARSAQDAEKLAEKIRENRLSSVQEKEAARQTTRLKYSAWREYAKNGGTLPEFEKAWPTIQEKLIAESLQNPPKKPARTNAHL